MSVRQFFSLPLALGLIAATASSGWATIPYSPVSLPPGAVPSIGPGLITPKETFGKEYSHNLDTDTTGLGGGLDPEQVIAWDGGGGTTDGFDFSGTRGPNSPDGEIDAIANHNDALFSDLRADGAHLIFSVDDNSNVYTAPGAFSPTLLPSAGPLPLANGNVLGGAGELSYELAGAYHPPATQGVWATQPEINGMPDPADVDGVEVWGPEPAITGDADKYSLDIDAFSLSPAGGPVSVWNKSGTPYISHATIVATVTSLLGPFIGGEVATHPDFIDGLQAINLDALMVRDRFGDEDTFDETADGSPGDQIIFSIRQIVSPSDPDGYYATGSELFVLDASTGPAGASFLRHGGHLWDHAWTLTEMELAPGAGNGRIVLDINAIEAVGELVVPEPTGVGLTGLALVGLFGLRRRNG